MESIDVARRCARIAYEKRAQDLLIFEIGELLAVADYFVLATVRNRRQLKAIANSIRIELKEEGVRDLHTEGHGTERWLLLDYGDVVVHLFDEETRAYYDLESRWADAPRVDPQLPETPPDPEADTFEDAAGFFAGASESADDEFQSLAEEEFDDAEVGEGDDSASS